MAKKQSEPKQVLEREYIVPLRKGWLKVPEYKRASKAIKTLKEFLAKHMKVYDRDLRKIKLDILLNNEIRFRGMRKPPARIKVKAVKYDDGIVRVELVNIPYILKYKIKRDKKTKEEIEKKVKEKESGKRKEEVEKKPDEESIDDKEKEISSRDEGLKIAENQAKQIKHTTKDKNVIVKRKSLSR